MNTKQILIIGSKGFLGSNLLNYFSNAGYKVKTLSRENGDLLDFSSWKILSVSENYEAIYFCAEKSGNQIFFENNSAVDLINYNGQLITNLDKFIKGLQINTKIFVFGSLWTAFSKLAEIKENDLFKNEKNTNLLGLTMTKTLLFKLVQKINRTTKHKASILTTGTLYGPNDKSGHLVPSILSKLAPRPEELKMFGKGDSIRNFTYVEDLCFWLKKILNSNLVCPESLIIASDKNYRISDVVEVLAKKFDVKKLIWGEKIDNFKIRIPLTNKFSNLYYSAEFAFRGIETFDKRDLIKWINKE